MVITSGSVKHVIVLWYFEFVLILIFLFIPSHSIGEFDIIVGLSPGMWIVDDCVLIPRYIILQKIPITYVGSL